MIAPIPKFSLITTCKGRLEHLRRTLPLMVDQSDSEVIVVDYDCPQGTQAWVRAQHPTVQVLKVEAAPVFNAAKARNCGAELARGDWLVFVDADVLLSRGLCARIGPQLRAGRYYRPRLVAPDLHGTVVCSRDDFLQIGGYDEAIRSWGGEDRDLYHRLNAALGRRVSWFPHEWLKFIEHSDAARVAFAELGDKPLSQRVNALYLVVKHDLSRLSGQSVFTLQMREQLYERIRRRVLEGAALGQAVTILEVDATNTSAIVLPPGCPLARTLRYELRVPGVDAGTAPVPEVTQAKLESAPSRASPPSVAALARAAKGVMAEFRTIKQAPLSPGPAVFAMVRNESYLLPHFLHHYRRLGVENFVVYNDHSTDDTLDLLAAQDDCTILSSDRGYREVMPDGRSFQLHAKRDVPESLGAGRWVLTVDADEFLVLPPCFTTLQQLFVHLDALGHRCVFASMVDFYPERLADRNHARELSPFAGSGYFDADRPFERSWSSTRPRARLKGIRARLLAMLEAKDPAAYERIVVKQDYRLTSLWKVPLIKTGCGVALEAVHEVNVQPPFDIELALAHFKFGPDLDGRIASALVKRDYFRSSIEYQFLKAALDALDAESLVCPSSRLYAGPRSLEAAGFVLVDKFPVDVTAAGAAAATRR